MSTKQTFIYLFLLISLIGCNSESTETKTETPTNEKKVEAPKNDSQTNYCFRNEYPHEGSEDKDILELEINANGDAIRGKYNWLPAFKDQRKGIFRGQIIDNVVKGEYSFQQEGSAQTVPIEIILSENEAIVEGGNVELGLNQTIEKVDCKD